MYWLIFIVEMGGLFIAYAAEWWALTIWILALIILESLVNDVNKRFYLEVIEDYPVKDCVKPKICKFLFKKVNNLSYKDVPKEMYFLNLIVFWGFEVYTIIGFIILFFDEYITSIIGAGYILIVSGIEMICINKIERKRFLNRYKLLNRYNLKYYFYKASEPYPKKVGKCNIMEEYRRGRKNFAVVSMVDTGEVRKKVLLLGERNKDKDRVYNVYEICKVYYIA